MRVSELETGDYKRAYDRPQNDPRSANGMRQTLSHDLKRKQSVVELMFSDPDVERQELELAMAGAELQQAWLEVEQLKADILATLADAQKTRAETQVIQRKAIRAR